MLDESGFIVSTKRRTVDKSFGSLIKSMRPIEFMSDEELLSLPTGSILFFDVECYANFFYIAFKSLDNGKFVAFELSPGSTINQMKLNFVLWRFCIVGFNSKNYDIPIITLALTGASCADLKEASDYMIKSGPSFGLERTTPFSFEKKYRVKIAAYNHIDLIEVAPLQGSLKLYAGRLHCERMQDLPIEPDAILSESDAEIIRPYCCNDLNSTELLFKEMAPEIKLRVEMSRKYGIDLRSKSDAQIAEAVICSELKPVLGYYPRRPNIESDFTLAYSVPAFIGFNSSQLQAVLQTVGNTIFKLDGMGAPEMPKTLEKLKVKIGGAVYSLGMGGIHSNEKKTAHYATEEIIIADNDVESFYPATILNQRLFPAHLGESFLDVYEKLKSTRLDAKRLAGEYKKKGDKESAKVQKTIADSLKIVINGSFGKFGSKWSALYSPQLLLQVTLTGQLVLLMLIEAMDEIGIEVISANTDGIILKYHKYRHAEVRKVITKWERRCNYKTEETRYKAVYSRDVNSYIAQKSEGGEPDSNYMDEKLGCKTKGAYCERGSALNSRLSKNPETVVCVDAVLSYLVDGIPVETTIKSCRDFTRFVSVRNVKGGGEKNGKYLGKVVRWYYAKNEAGYIAYVLSGNKVAKTDGAKPVMDLPETFPDDIDYAWYIKEALEMLEDCGAIKGSSQQFLF